MIRCPTSSKRIKIVVWRCHQEPQFFPALGSTTLRVLVLASGSSSPGFKMLYQPWFHITLWGHQSVQLSRTLWLEGPHTCFMLCWCHLENLKNIIFELGFCEWNFVGQWSMPRNRGDIHNMHGCPSLLPLLHAMFVMPVSTKSQWMDPHAWESSETQSQC